MVRAGARLTQIFNYKFYLVRLLGLVEGSRYSGLARHLTNSKACEILLELKLQRASMSKTQISLSRCYAAQSSRSVPRIYRKTISSVAERTDSSGRVLYQISSLLVCDITVITTINVTHGSLLLLREQDLKKKVTFGCLCNYTRNSEEIADSPVYKTLPYLHDTCHI